MGRTNAVKRCKLCLCFHCDMPYMKSDCHCKLRQKAMKKSDIETCDNYKLMVVDTDD